MANEFIARNGMISRGNVVVTGSLTTSGSLTTTGTITATTLVVQTITSSISSITGSTNFGSLAANTHTFTGSMSVSGSGTFNSALSGTSATFSGNVNATNGLLIGNGGSTATTNYLPKFTGASTIGNSSASDNGTTFDVSIQGKFTGASGARILTLNAPTDGGSLTFESGGTAYADMGSNKGILGTGSATNFYLGTRGGSSLAFGTANTARLFLDTSGNLGLGVVDPDIFSRGDARMVGIGASGASDNLALALNAGASGGRGAQIYMGQGGTRHFTISSNVSESTLGTTSNTPLKFTTNDTERMRIDSSGGILFRGSTTASNGVYLSNDSSLFKMYAGDSTSSTKGFAFYVTNGSTQPEAMRITSGGVVNVGSTSGINLGERFNVIAYSLSSPTLSRFYVNVSGALSTSAARFDKFDNNSTTSQVFLDFTINNQNTANGSITANGANQATFTSWSDRRLKENITNLPSQLSNIMALRPVEFDYKDGSGHQIGFIAQEVQEIYPDIVGENAEGYLTISGLSKMESRLIKAIQELEARVQYLENK
jgi:hypothetical protein